MTVSLWFKVPSNPWTFITFNERGIFVNGVRQ